jgi:hypothetical protein
MGDISNRSLLTAGLKKPRIARDWNGSTAETKRFIEMLY